MTASPNHTRILQGCRSIRCVLNVLMGFAGMLPRLVEYDRAAKIVDADLVGSAPSRAQLHRWLAGEMKGLPYPHHCRVLEAMFPGWPVDQLFEQSDSKSPGPMPQIEADNSHSSGDEPSESWPMRDAEAATVFATRSEFASRLPPHILFDNATTIDLSGLSLNLLCQGYADERLRKTIEGGACVRALFLDPGGDAVRRREQEEGHRQGHLSALTEVNIDALNRVRNSLPAASRERLDVGTYDETIRFNIVIVDGHLCCVQPYLPYARGVESPTLVMRRRHSPGTVEAFQRVFSQLWERRLGQ
jgi:Domain of unknown function (DUF5919)